MKTTSLGAMHLDLLRPFFCLLSESFFFFFTAVIFWGGGLFCFPSKCMVYLNLQGKLFLCVVEFMNYVNMLCNRK